ncbi:MAG TPA: hypothetical protein VHF26_03775, partial [Trebonia sp.]|nr:hypothetical protein [Trebonia sp.]
MGLTSGRGSRGGTRRRDAASAGQDIAGQLDGRQTEGGPGRTSLVGGDPRLSAYRGTPVAGGTADGIQRGGAPVAGYGYAPAGYGTGDGASHDPAGDAAAGHPTGGYGYEPGPGSGRLAGLDEVRGGDGGRAAAFTRGGRGG